MKLSQFFLPTLKEEPSDAVIPSHKLMIRTGMIRQLTAGVYSYLPLGLRVFRRIENIVREEMNSIGCNEFYLPALTPIDLWNQSGRLGDFGDDIFKIKNRDMVLAPTHEEVFTTIAKPNLVSYKNLPQMWYQIQTKFRNEARPRGGVLRVRQFTMKDAYSFDSTWEGLDISYNKQDTAYRNIFSRCGLKFFVVKAFSGAMGGRDSEEFMIETETGEDNVVLSEDGSYASNLEVAVAAVEKVHRKDSNQQIEEIYTPNIKTIDELADFLKITDKSRLAKSRVYVNPAAKNSTSGTENEFMLVFVCGDDEVNESKLQALFGIGIRPAQPEELKLIAGAEAGSIGPIGFKTKDVRMIADFRLQDADELISGANKDDYHFKNIDFKRDVKKMEYYDLRTVRNGDFTKDKKSKLRITKAIELGHIFKLGTKFSDAFGARFLDKNGDEKPIIMGSYGIGMERIAAAYIEQNHDENGIIWGGEIAPFKIHLICVNPKNDIIRGAADNFYNKLTGMNLDVLYDDRTDISPGFKFKDADLIGVPLQIIISEKTVKNEEIELKIRRNSERLRIKYTDIENSIPSIIKKL